MSEFDGLWKQQNNPACTKSVSRLRVRTDSSWLIRKKKRPLSPSFQFNQISESVSPAGQKFLSAAKATPAAVGKTILSLQLRTQICRAANIYLFCNNKFCRLFKGQVSVTGQSEFPCYFNVYFRYFAVKRQHFANIWVNLRSNAL